MNTAPSPTPKSYAERIAWLHEPVHLRCALLPWFVLRWMELELHRFFCSLERYLLALVELNAQGKLAPGPVALEQARPRGSHHYKLKLAPAAPVCGAGAAHAPVLGAEALAVAAAGEMAQGGSPWAGMVIVPLLAVAQGAASRGAACGRGLNRRAQADAGWVSMPPDRCRMLKIFRPGQTLWENCA